MATQPVEAKYRISFLLDDALKSLRQLRQGMADLTAPQASTEGLNKSVAETEQRIKKVRTAQSEATRADTAEQRAAAKQAADEALKAKRTQLAEERRLAKEARDAEIKLQREAREKERREAKAAEAAQRAADKKANFEAYQKRALAPQLTDITVGLATGQSPFYVALQQGGQLRDIYGSIGGALKALGSIFTVTRVLVGGFTAALFAVGTAAAQGHFETDALNKSLALTGNVAQVSAASLDRSARAIADAQKVSIASVKEALVAAQETGLYLGPTLDSAGRAATALSRLTGKAAIEQIGNFDAMANGVAEWAVKQNRAYNFLTVAEFEHIRSLEAAGREQEAMRAVLDKLSATMEQRATPAVGIFERAWLAVKKAVSDTGEELKKIGRPETLDTRIEALQGQLQRNNMANWRGGRSKAQVEADAAGIQAQLDPLINQRNRDQLRQSEAAIDMTQVNEDLKRQQKPHQDALAQVEAAGIKQRLAQDLAGLDQRQAALERANARGLITANSYEQQLNAIEQRRSAAQVAQLEKQVALESRRTVGKPEDVLAQKARVQELQTQLVEQQSRLRLLASQGRGIVDAAALEDARASAAAWAQTWQQSADQVRAFRDQAAQTDAQRMTAPTARAEAEAAIAIAALKRQMADLERDLKLRISLTIDPAQRSLLEQQLKDLTASAARVETDQGNAARQASYRTQWAEATDALTVKEQELDRLVQRGAIDAEEAERRKFAARDQALPQLRTLLAEMKRLAEIGNQGDRIAVEKLGQTIVELSDRTTEFQASLRSNVGSGLRQMFNDVGSGAETALGAVKKFIGGIASSMLDVISKRLGDQLLESLLPKGGGGWLATAAQYISKLFQYHDGGVIGTGGGAARSLGIGTIAAAMAAGLPYYHSGGISGMAGLRSNEELAVLKHGEEVLTEDNPRHVANWRGGGLSIGALSISAKVEGAQGDATALQGAGDRLTQVMRGAIDQWAADESREGGVLARGRT